MNTYHFRFLKDGKTLFQTYQDEPDDLVALEEAEKLSGDFEIEIWRGGRFVARLKKDNAPLDERDRASN